jgi:transcriptional regulator with XRE-family HTH domain
VRKVLRVEEKIGNLEDFRLWVKIQLIKKGISQNELARKMGIPQARISEATHGKQAGNKYIPSIIQELDGDLENFNGFLKSV